MSTLAQTQASSPDAAKAKRSVTGLLCAAAVATIGMIGVAFVVEQGRSGVDLAAAAGSGEQMQLRDLLCRIDRRCPPLDLSHRTVEIRESSNLETNRQTR